MQQFLTELMGTLGTSLPNLVFALVILIGGWLIALIVSAGIRKLLQKTDIDDRIVEKMGTDKKPANIQPDVIISKFVFYILMIFVLIAFFQQLGLTIITEPLNNFLNKLFEFAPNVLGGLVLLLIAWIVASVVRFLISKALGATSWDDKLSASAGLEEERQVPMSETLANVVYWFIFLLFLPAILGAFQLEGILGPIQGMLDSLLGYIPNLLGAGIILLVGWFVARIIRQVVTGLLVAAGADKLGERIGLKTDDKEQSLSGIIGLVVYALVIIPVIIASLNALQIEAISGPATAMLTTLLSAIPAVFGAMVILGIAYMIGKLVAGLVTNVLTGVGFNKVLSWIGLGGEPEEGKLTPSEVVGYLVMVGFMLFAVIEAAEMMSFSIVAELVAAFFGFAMQVILGIIVFGLALYLANLAYKAISSLAGSQSPILAQAARIAIIVLGAAMALRQMGIANDIINMAFGLLLGAIAVAVALAFGLGSREIAARQVEGWLDGYKASKDK